MNVKLLITGICTFVPEYPLEVNEGNKITVLMAESVSPVEGHSGHSHGVNELHIPVLVCPEEYVVKGHQLRLPDATFWSTSYPSNISPSRLMAVFYLDDQHVTVIPDKVNALDIAYNPVDSCPGDGDSFCWVAPLAKVNPGSQKVRSSCFDKFCDKKVISRLILDQGVITTAKFATDLAGTVRKWAFLEDGNGKRPKVSNEEGRAIAAIVGAELDVDAWIEFKTDLFEEYGGGHRTSSNRRIDAIFKGVKEKSLRIRLKPTDNKPEIWIKNMPWLDILQIRPLQEKDCDPHFAHVYKLSDVSGGAVSAKLPCAVGECPEFGPDRRHAGGTDCPPAGGAPRQGTPV
jgi:hypothetical protein